MKIAKILHLPVLIALLLALFPVTVGAQDENGWVAGPAVVDIGKELAQVKLSEEYIFADAEMTQQIMEQMGNPTSGQELGLIAPKDEKSTWFVLFEYNPVGYVPDDDADQLDATAILESIREATAEANQERARNGEAEMRVIGWQEEPHYDKTTHNLVWTIIGESTEKSETYRSINHNVRVLGRTGYTSVVLVADPETLSAVRPKLDGIVSNFSYKTGKNYAEYKQGDKIASYGLTALVAGGVGAAAAKTGLLKGLFKLIAAGGKAIILVIIAIFAAIGRFFKGLFGKGESQPVEETFTNR